MTEIRVHAASAEEARSDGAAALGVDPRAVQVEVIDSDQHGVTARVIYDEHDPPAAPDSSSSVAAESAESGDAAEPQTDHAAAAYQHLNRVLTLMGVEATVEVTAENEDEVTLNIEGDDLGAVIGSFGQTLNALQFLINLMVSRHGRRRRIGVDAGGYRERRRTKLEEIALEHAQRAKDERRGVIIEGLRAAERRIIHTALQNDPDVVTFSEGEEPHRRLVISPRTSNN